MLLLQCPPHLISWKGSEAVLAQQRNRTTRKRRMHMRRWVCQSRKAWQPHAGAAVPATPSSGSGSGQVIRHSRRLLSRRQAAPEPP